MKKKLIFFLLIFISSYLTSCYIRSPEIIPSLSPLPTPLISTNTSLPIQPSITPTIFEIKKIQDLIGLTVPPYPKEVDNGGGEILGLSDYQWGLGFVNFQGSHYILLKKFITHDSKGRAFWKYLDYLQMPTLLQDEVIITSGCLLNNVMDIEIITVALLDKESWVTRFVKNPNIRRAWRAERDIGKFEEIETVGISCYADMAYSYTMPTLRPTHTP